MLCSSSSSIHGPGTRASRAAAKRALSSGTLPRATAAATRTNAAVGASSTGPVPALIVPLPAPRSLIVSLLQSAFYTQLPYRLTPRVHVGSGGEPGRTRPETELLEHGRHGECRTDRVPVSDLERDAESLLREEGTVHTLGADLGDQAPGGGPHDLGTGPTLTGDEVWVAQHGLDNAERGSGNAELPGKVGRTSKASLLLRVPRSAFRVCQPDRKSTRLNSSHGYISYAVFCLKKKKI